MIGFNPAPKKTYKQPAKSKDFSKAMKIKIFEYDQYCCACCKSNRIESVPHHCIFKSQGGSGEFENGATVCTTCHKWAHGLSKGPNGEPTIEGRKWFEDYRMRKMEAIK